MDLTEARSLLGQGRDAIPTGQWGANVTTAVQRALVCRREGSGRGVRYVPVTRTP
jgi:hypothetical protein